jgi:hypothetical protein
MKYNNINKENFFNVMEKNYPFSVKHFFNWIDDYKQKNNWSELFNSNSIKFHDLPFEMQFGIIINYVQDLASKKLKAKGFPKDYIDFYVAKIPLPYDIQSTREILSIVFQEEEKLITLLN